MLGTTPNRGALVAIQAAAVYECPMKAIIIYADDLKK
jgi:hypothetical protein